MKAGASSFFQITILVCSLSAVRAHGQATEIAFCNHCLPSPPDRLVRDVSGNPLVGTNYVAQLYIGGTPDTLMSHTAAPARFRIAPTSLPGTWAGGNRTVVSPGSGPIVLQVRVWDITAGATYEQASQNTIGLQFGRSAAFNYDPCGYPIRLPNCELMLGFRGFTLVTNAPTDPTPADRTLTIRENGNLVDVLYTGSHTIQAAPTIRGPWANVHTSTSPFTDPASATNNVRFYRMSDEPGPTYSVNMVGYYKLSLCNGFSMIANQLNAHGGNRLADVFKSPPEGTRIYKFNPMTGGFLMAQFVDGEWESGDQDLWLNPGEGAFFWSTLTSHRFLGDVPMGSIQVQIPAGFSLISNPLPEAGPVSLLPPDGLGLPVRDGTRIFQWDCATQGFIFNQFLDGMWDSGAPPTVAIGEAFYFYNPGFGLTWNRSFTVGP